MTRDEKIATAIAQTDHAALAVKSDVWACVKHAEAHDAPAHARMYLAAFEALNNAHDLIGYAHKIMVEGDPAEHEEDDL